MCVRSKGWMPEESEAESSSGTYEPETSTSASATSASESTSASSSGSDSATSSAGDGTTVSASGGTSVHKGFLQGLYQRIRPQTRAYQKRMASGQPPFPPMAMLIPFPFFPGQELPFFPPPPPPLEKQQEQPTTSSDSDREDRNDREGTEEDFTDQSPVPKRMRRSEDEIIRSYTRDEKAYYRGLPRADKLRILDRERELKEKGNHLLEPMRFKILNSDMDPSTKSLVLIKLDQFQNMWEGAGEYFKLKAWLQAVCRLPLGIYNRLPIQPSDPMDQIATYLQGVRRSLDSTVYGHKESKDQMMRIIAQWISNPDSRGHAIGISGPPGAGKTVLVKEGICKALNLPFGFMALGGASDGSFLDGHGFTYEGSTYGKIAEVLMKTRCMNPILFFDELDKVSQTRRGDEIYNILVHLTDVSQNERFQDRYFGEIEMDLSRALMVFSYNDESLINPILKDRMITIHVKGYSKKEKIEIATGYLLPDILRQYRLDPSDIVFSKDIIETIIERVPEEEGVRNLKRGLESIVSWLNMHRYIPPEKAEPITFPVSVTEKHVKEYLTRREDPTAAFMRSLYT